MASYNPKSLHAEEFIHDGEIRETLAYAEANKNNVELIDAIHADESMGSMSAGREISSMSNDGVSVSFAASGASATMAASARYMAIIHDWLDGETTEAGVHLLYAGCDA